MVQLNSEGEYMEHGQLDSKNTRTEWRRADRAGQKQSDLSPWRLTGETALQSWPEANDRNHSISVNLDYVAPDVHSLVFVARARGAASGPVEVPQVVLLAPKDGEKEDSRKRKENKLSGVHAQVSFSFPYCLSINQFMN